MLDIHLKIVPTSRLILHETVDPKRVRAIRSSIRESRLFKNPIIISRLPHSSNYLVLDGANRTSALRSLHVPTALVQEYGYNSADVKLQTWSHVLEEGSLDAWIKTFSSVVPFSPRQRLHQEKLFDPTARLYVCTRKRLMGANIPAGRAERLRVLNAITGLYKGKKEFRRVPTSDVLTRSDIAPNEPVVVYPLLTKKDIVEITLSRLVIPSGISRHTVTKRALHIHLPLSVLHSSASLQKQNSVLRAHLARLIDAKCLKYYDGSVYLFDE